MPIGLVMCSAVIGPLYRGGPNGHNSPLPAWRLARDRFYSKSSGLMHRNPILDLPLAAVLRTEIALPLQQILNINTVGALLTAWRSPLNHPHIEDLFDSPGQARNAVATCATWLGVRMQP